MSRFEVITAELLAASGAVKSTGAQLAHSQGAVTQSGAAMSGTPVAGAFDGLVGSLHRITAGLTQASGELSAALADVADAYQQADGSAADSLSGR